MLNSRSEGTRIQSGFFSKEAKYTPYTTSATFSEILNVTFGHFNCSLWLGFQLILVNNSIL